jgi:WS/DGAT/MGAT family acyltransferase
MKRERIMSNDAIWLQDSAVNLMVINAVIITDHLDLRTLRTTFQRRIFEGQDPQRFERYRCRAGGNGRRRYWEPDPEFDLKRHIIPGRVKHLDGPEAVQAYLGREAGKALDPGHPLWQIQVIDGFGEGATVLLVRIHHSIGDGETLVELLLSLVDETPGQKGRHGIRPARSALGGRWLDGLLRTASIAASAPGILLRRLTWMADSSPMHGPALSGNKRVAWTRPLDLDVVKRAKQHIGATVNDVLMASVSGAFSHYLLDHGSHTPSRFLVSMPVSVRGQADSSRSGNCFAPVPLELPAGRGVHGHRILAVKERMDRLKGSPAPLVIYHLQRALISLLPHPVSRLLIDFLANKCSAVVTNVKGPAADLAIGGRQVRFLMFWVPQRARIGIGISILSFSGKVQVGVMADEALVPDPAALIQAFEDEFETLKMLADLAPDQPAVPPAGRRKPARSRPPRAKARPKADPGPVERAGEEPRTESKPECVREEPLVAPGDPETLPDPPAAGPMPERPAEPAAEEAVLV